VNNSYSNLHLFILRTPEMREKHCGYTYLVRADGFSPHTAFRTAAGLRRFLRYSGLRIDTKRIRRGWHQLIGSYAVTAHQDAESFTAKLKKGAWVEPILSNGTHTLGIIHKGGGKHTVEYLLPCVDSRPSCSYFWE
jgi:hypothetical protein